MRLIVRLPAHADHLAMREEPRLSPGQTVWHPVKHNGIIRWIDYTFDIVHVDFYDNGYLQLTRDDFPGNFDEGLNQWILIPA